MPWFACAALAASAATLTVANVDDSDPGSLRDTIAVAASGDTVDFATNLSGQTITLIGQITTSNSPTNGVPFLALLGNYGGPTQTMPPLPGLFGTEVAIERSTNLVDWVLWQNLTLDFSPTNVMDTNTAPMQFYRIVAP